MRSHSICLSASDSFHSAECSPGPSMLCKWQDFPLFCWACLSDCSSSGTAEVRGWGGVPGKKETNSQPFTRLQGGIKTSEWNGPSPVPPQHLGPSREQCFWVSSWHSLQKCVSDGGGLSHRVQRWLQGGYGLGQGGKLKPRLWTQICKAADYAVHRPN